MHSPTVPTKGKSLKSSQQSTSTSTNSGGKNAGGPQGGILRLALVATGICVCYVYYGILQERLFTGGERLGASFVLMTQTVTNIVVAAVWKQIQRVIAGGTSRNSDPPKKLPLRHALLFMTSFFYMGAMVCSNEAIQYVSYPVAVLAKSCKLVPTMLVGQLVESRLYSKQEWLAALCISVGIGVFQYSRMITKGSAKDDGESIYGIILLLGSLTLDGVLSACQNMIRASSEKYRSPNAIESMLFINTYSLVFVVPLCMYNGQMAEGLKKLFQDDMAFKIMILNLTVGFGQICVFLCLTWYSSIVTTTITTTRKFITILMSVMSFGHSFTIMQWISIALVFFGLYVSVLQQRKSKSKQD